MSSTSRSQITVQSNGAGRGAIPSKVLTACV